MSNADYLLWDDPFSSVDILSEKKIIERLRRYLPLKGKTIIVTSHRVSTVGALDNITFLEKKVGIIESGDANDLLTYNKLNPSKTYEYFKDQMV